MTTNAPADVLSGGRELRLDRMGQWVVEANQRLRPADGWLTALLLALNLMVVVWSVEKADWVSTPSLAFLILLATATGLVLSRIPVWGALILPLGLALGVLVITWQLTSYGAGSLALTDSADLWQRLGQWYTAAKSGDINLDIVPFAFALMSLTWLLGYLAAWMLFPLRKVLVGIYSGWRRPALQSHLPARRSVHRSAPISIHRLAAGGPCAVSTPSPGMET